jgi:hypothetical protein
VRGKLPLSADVTIFYGDNLKDSSKKLLVIINELYKIAGYTKQHTKISSISTNNDLSENEIKKIKSFTIATKS